MVKKDAMAYFWRITIPHPTALITTVSKDGKPNITTVA
jgi:flavin reductase (DIM6/NTAB) family NADH-FMN oxidoreductase RutF